MKLACQLAAFGFLLYAVASAPPVAADAAPMNNLDAEIASSVRAKAESLGVSY